MMSSRTERIKERTLQAEPTVSSERAQLFTNYVKTHMQESIQLRMAKAFANVLENMTIRIEEDELIVGNMGPTPRSCQVFPEYSWSWINEELDRLEKRRTERFFVTEKDREILREVFGFWKGKSIAEICAGQMSDDSIAAAKAGVFTIGAPGTGIGHFIIDYKRVLQEGLESILKQISELAQKVNKESAEFYQAVEITLRAVIRLAQRFSEAALEIAKTEQDADRREELHEISRICAAVPAKPATSFHEALQSFWFIHLLVQTESNGHSVSTGRFDQYMYPFYERDLREGNLTREEALELIEMLWVKFTSLIKLRDEYYSVAFAGHPMFQNLTIGGQDIDGNDASNELTEIILEATGSIRVTQPTVSFRWHDKISDKLKTLVVKTISKGLGMPGLFNDNIIIPMMVEKGTNPAEAYNYSILGCVEPIIEGESDPRQNIGYVNLPKILEVTLNNGWDPRTKTQVGPKTGIPQDFVTFHQLWEAYEIQIDHTIELLTKADRVAADVHASFAPTLLISALIKDCLEKGLNLQQGGARYCSGGIMGVGIAIVADSLSMLRKYVYETKTVSMKDFMEILSTDFEGHENFRVKLQNDPEKYGNDIEAVDLLARDVGQVFCRAVQKRLTTRGGPYHGALFSVSMYIPQGEILGATPNGRKAGIMLSDGVSPTQNQDTHGPTAAMKSVARLDHGLCYNGTLYNMKFTPSYFDSESSRKKFASLVDSYFKLDGFHVQFNVVDRETLEDAKMNPLKHRDLIVRVAGYSAYFIELDPFVQDEVIARTEFSKSD